MFDQIVLEPEQEELLAMLVNAQRSLQRNEREKFITVQTGQGPFIVMHPGLPSGSIETYSGDVDVLGRAGLLLTSYTRQGTMHFDVTPLGFRYHEQAQQRRTTQPPPSTARQDQALASEPTPMSPAEPGDIPIQQLSRTLGTGGESRAKSMVGLEIDEELRRLLEVTGTTAIDVRLICVPQGQRWHIKRLRARRYTSDPPFPFQVDYPTLRVLRDRLDTDGFLWLLECLQASDGECVFRGVPLSHAPLRLHPWRHHPSQVSSGLDTFAMPVWTREGSWFPSPSPDPSADEASLASAGARYFSRVIAGEAWYLYDIEFPRHANRLPDADITLADERGYITDIRVEGTNCVVQCVGTHLAECLLDFSTPTGQWEQPPAAAAMTFALRGQPASVTVVLLHGAGWLDRREDFPTAGGSQVTRRADMGKQRGQVVTEPTAHDFAVAFSFAGPQRHIAERLATSVRAAGYNVFYDAFYDADLWGKDLNVFFDEVYRKRARFCVMLISQEYIDRIWTNKERQSAQARALAEKGGEYILPIKVEDVALPGMPPTIGYVSTDRYTIEQLAQLLVRKLQGTIGDMPTMDERHGDEPEQPPVALRAQAQAFVPDYQGYPEETLLRARPRLHMVVNDFVQVAATNDWAARSAPNVVGAWYENGRYARDDNDTINAHYRYGWSLLKGCQNHVRQHRQPEAEGLEVGATTADDVRLTDAPHRITYTVKRRYYDAFVVEGDVLLPVYSVTADGAGGTYVIVVRNGVVMAAMHARTPSIAILNRALDRGWLPRVSRDDAPGPTRL